MRRVYKNLCPATISASIMVANTWKNSLKNVESYNNKIFYEALLDFLQLNGTCFLNKPRTFRLCDTFQASEGRDFDLGNLLQLFPIGYSLLKLTLLRVKLLSYENIFGQ